MWNRKCNISVQYSVFTETRKQIVRVVLKTDSSVDMEQQKENILEEVIIFEH